MTEHRIPIDPRNPGLYFACCGLFEIAELLAPGGLAWFEDNGRVFVLATDAALPPELPALREQTPEEQTRFEKLKAIQPLTLTIAGCETRLNWWLNDTETDKSPLKTWGGQQTSRRVLSEVLGLLDPVDQVAAMFDYAKYTTTRFGVDGRSAWEPIDLGYSPNDITRKEARTYPWVEVLAVVGLQGFRPSGHRRQRDYATWLVPLPLATARAASAAPWSGLAAKRFRFEVMSRGQGYKTFAFAKELKDGSQSPR